MPNNYDNDYKEVYKALSSNAEDIKIENFEKLLNDIIEKQIKQLSNSFEETYKNKLKSIGDDLCRDLKNDFKNELKDIREGTKTKWWIIGSAVIIALAGLVGYFANKYIESLNTRFKDYQTFCERIVDEKIKNITLKK